MNEIIPRKEGNAPPLDPAWNVRLDALIRGECSEDDFMEELSNSRLTGADSAWSVVALLDQRYRRGQMPLELFRSIESKIAKRELDTLDYGTTIELVPAPAPGDAIEIEIDAVEAAVHAGAQSARVLRDRYVLDSRLGGGGMGAVFRAVDLYRGDLAPAERMVAVKFLHEKADGRAAALPNLRRRFYCAQGLSHPNIAKVYELDRDGDSEFFTMELLEGEPLSRVIEKLDPLSMSRSRAWAIIREAAGGLAHAHSRDVLHGALEPRNMMVTQSGEIRLLGFVTSSPSASAYASCELLEGQRADPRDDLFALACLSYELLAGEHPFQRRLSTEARDLGLVARRPRDLTGRQWRALTQGLAWRRQERSISVRDWIAQLYPARAQARRAWMRTTALLAALVFGLAFSALFNRPLFDKKGRADRAPQTSSQSMAILPSAEPAVKLAPALQTSADAPIPAPPAPAAASAPASTPASSPSPSPSPQKPQPRTRSGAPVATKAPDMLHIAAATYRVGAHKNFAEIHVQSSNGSGNGTSFTWWTEPSSALPGTDYVPQDRTVQTVSSRSHVASLFVKLLPNVSRKQQAIFYVVIAEAGKGAALGRVTRAAVVLPPQ